MSDQAGRPRDASNHDRLNGWKEVAAYLGKSVRTVQRWERELRLPVRRIRTAGGEIVFAFRSELDKWQAEVDQQSAAQVEQNGWHAEQAPQAREAAMDNDVEHMEESISATPNGGAALESNSGGTRRWIAVAAVVVAAVMLWAGWRSGLLGPVDRQPAFWHVKDNTLQVFNSKNDPLWEHHFSYVLTADMYNSPAKFLRPLSIAIDDLDHDGDKELLMVTWGDPRYAQRLLCFNRDGSMRFEVQPNQTMRYGGKNEDPPYFVQGFVLTSEPEGTKTIWAKAVHNFEFPSVVWKLDSQGKVAAEYWSNGHINVLQEGRYSGRRVMFVGAMHNERFATSLAVLDYEHPSGSAPAENLKYKCENCPAGEPLQFYVFPRTEMSQEFNVRPFVSQIRTQADGHVILTVLQSLHSLRNESVSSGTDVWYTLDEDLRLVEAETGDSYRRLHSHSELIDHFKHPFGPKCEGQILPVLAWNGKRFIELSRPRKVHRFSPLSAHLARN